MAKLRVMLIDESQERSAAIAELLKAVQCDVVACFSPEEDLLQQVARIRPDVVRIPRIPRIPRIADRAGVTADSLDLFSLASALFGCARPPKRTKPGAI